MLTQESYLGRQIPEIGFWRPHITGSAGAVTAPDSYAAQAGMEILQAGGNAADAAAAAFLAIGVAEPFHAGIGGGCFQLFYHRQSRQFLAVDARGAAPLGSYLEMFLDERGEVDPEQTDYSGRSAAIPAAYRGLDLLLKKYGTMTWKQVPSRRSACAARGLSAGLCMNNAPATRRPGIMPRHLRDSVSCIGPRENRPGTGRCCTIRSWPTQWRQWPKMGWTGSMKGRWAGNLYRRPIGTAGFFHRKI